MYTDDINISVKEIISMYRLTYSSHNLERYIYEINPSQSNL